MKKNTSFAIPGANTFVPAWFYDWMLEANSGGIVYIKNHLQEIVEVRSNILSPCNVVIEAYSNSSAGIV